VGSAATDRASHDGPRASGGPTYTLIDLANPANADGTLDTVESWWAYSEAGNEVKVGTFYLVSGLTYTCRDAQSIGEQTAGSKQTATGLDIDIVTGDFIGCDARTTKYIYVETDLSGGVGARRAEGQYCDASDSVAYDDYSTRSFSLYGTGETSLVVTPPTIDTLAATNIANSTAQVNAYVSNDGNETCDVRFEYGTVTETYTNATAWVNDTYITGDYPYAGLTGLDNHTQYFYRAAIANSNTTAYGTEYNFTTASGLSAPTSFKAIESANSVSLSWVKGTGSTSTIVRGKIGSFPTSSTDGTLVHSGTGGTATHENLVAGATYCYSCYASSGGVTSEDSADVKATVDLADVTVTETPGAPETPSTWWTAIDTMVLEDLPLYNEIDGVIDDYGVQSDTGWMFIVLVIVLILSAAAFGMSDGNIMVTGLAAAFLLLAFSLVHLLPLWMMGISIVMFVSLAAMRERV
jgi:hypothetical protein